MVAGNIPGHLECIAVIWGLFPHSSCYDGVQSNDYPLTLRSAVDSWFSNIVNHFTVRLIDPNLSCLNAFTDTRMQRVIASGT